MEDKTKIAVLETRLDHVTRRLDEVLRHCRLAPIMDEQLMAINARKDALAKGRAA